MTTKQSLSLEDISRLGEKFYTEKLKEKLEKEHMGKLFLAFSTETLYADY